MNECSRLFNDPRKTRPKKPSREVISLLRSFLTYFSEAQAGHPFRLLFDQEETSKQRQGDRCFIARPYGQKSSFMSDNILVKGLLEA